MKIFTAGGYLTFWDFDSNIYKKNHISAGLIPRSEHLLKDVTYVTWHNK